ncbi:thiol-disulfide oxidoreductase YkuV [Bacillaceae bacterium]
MPMRLGTPLPDLNGYTGTFNSPVTRDELLGYPTLVHFWAVSCHICHETMPEVMNYKEEFSPQGLKFVAVHMPRQESDTDIEKVKADIERFGMDQPVLLDHRHQIAKAFQNEYVPAFFLFNKAGELRFRAAGDKGFQKVREKILQVLENEA